MGVSERTCDRCGGWLKAEGDGSYKCLMCSRVFGSVRSKAVALSVISLVALLSLVFVGCAARTPMSSTAQADWEDHKTLREIHNRDSFWCSKKESYSACMSALGWSVDRLERFVPRCVDLGNKDER